MENNKIKEMLINQDSTTRTTALHILLHKKEKKDYLNELLKCVSSLDKDVKLAAIMVLGKIRNKKIVPYLEKALEDSSFRIKILAAISLAKYKNEKAIPILKSALEKDISDHSLHKKTIEALGLYKDESLIDVFTEMLKHRRIVSRIKAADALSEISSKKVYDILLNAGKEEKDDVVKSRINTIANNIENEIS